MFHRSPSLSTAPRAPLDDLYLPIPLRKGTHTCTRHIVSHFISYDCLSPSFYAFTLSVTSKSITQSHVEAARVPTWKAEIDLEVEAFVSRGTFTLVPFPIDANIVTFKWVFTLTYYPNSTIARHKAHLVARGFTQVYGIDY